MDFKVQKRHGYYPLVPNDFNFKRKDSSILSRFVTASPDRPRN
jgi:hypothetical protein